jgi:hypothetical protein
VIPETRSGEILFLQAFNRLSTTQVDFVRIAVNIGNVHIRTLAFRKPVAALSRAHTIIPVTVVFRRACKKGPFILRELFSRVCCSRESP